MFIWIGLRLSMPEANLERATTEASLFPSGNVLPFVLVTALFFLWGIPNNLNDVLIRQFMKSFAISRFQAGLIQSAFYMGYFVLAVPAALIMKRLGYKAGFIIGLLLFGSGAFLFWPAAILGRYWFFLVALFVIASGLSFLETASNPFIAQCGDPQTSERRLNFSQAFNPIGSIAGVLVGTIFIFSGIELTPQQVSAMQASDQYTAYLQLETLRVVRPYIVLGIIAFVWAGLIARTKISPSSRGGRGRGKRWEYARSPGIPAFHSGSGGAVSLRGSTGRDLELFHSICSGLHRPAGKSCGLFSHRNAGGFRSGAVCLFLSDEVRPPVPVDGGL